MQVTALTVEITRDAMTRLVTDIPAHEIEVAQILFGRDNVNVLNDAAGVVELDENEEADRLVRKYGDAAIVETFTSNYHGKVVASMRENAADTAEDKPKRGRPAKTED